MISFLSTDRDKRLWLNVLFSQLMNLTPTIYLKYIVAVKYTNVPPPF
jgi:hypothetical protein